MLVDNSTYSRAGKAVDVLVVDVGNVALMCKHYVTAFDWPSSLVETFSHFTQNKDACNQKQ